MGQVTAKRVALMSIRPEFANAILAGKKTVEFRKRRVADDVSHVLIYATMPVGSLLGWFSVARQDTESPRQLWVKFRSVAGISEQGFFDYFADRTVGTGIVVGACAEFDEPVALTALSQVQRPPQSFQYLTVAQTQEFLQLAVAHRQKIVPLDSGSHST